MLKSTSRRKMRSFIMSRDFTEELQAIASDAVKATLAYARDRWIEEAQSGLKSSRSDYIQGLSGIYMSSPTSGYIELRGTFPVMTELGYGPYDMKSGFERSSNVKMSKEGKWYLTIPYRHSTSGGSINVMPSVIEARARQLNHGEQLAQAVVRQLGYKPETSWTGYKHKNSKYDSLTRIVKEYKSGRKHSQYKTWRRVSETSDPRSWMHPGYRGLKAMPKVEKDAGKFFYSYLE